MQTYLLIGLGNPGASYAKHRHNVGFMAVDTMAERYRCSSWSKKFRGLWAEGKIGQDKVLLLKPQTYMNLSGESVGEAMRFYKIPIENIIVIHDELDLDFGDAKLKKSGGNAGHNGLESIESHIGKDFLRFRFGIGKTQGDNSNHVLSNFSKEEQAHLPRMLDKVVENILPMVEQMRTQGAKNLKMSLLDQEKTAIIVSGKNMDPGLRRDDGK